MYFEIGDIAKWNNQCSKQIALMSRQVSRWSGDGKRNTNYLPQELGAGGMQKEGKGRKSFKQQPRRKAGVSKGSPMENPEGVWVVQEGGAEGCSEHRAGQVKGMHWGCCSTPAKPGRTKDRDWKLGISCSTESDQTEQKVHCSQLKLMSY